MAALNNLVNSIKSNKNYEYEFDSLNQFIDYIEDLPETKRLSIWIQNTETSISEIYDLFLSLEEGDDFLVSSILVALISINIDSMGFSMIVNEYGDVYPKASAIANSFILSRALND